MDTKSVILVAIGLYSFITAGYIFGRNKNSHINISFSLMYIFAGLWSFGLALFRLTSDIENLLIYAQIFNSAGILIAASFYYFTSSFPFPIFKLKLTKVLLMFLPAVVISLLIYIFPISFLGEISIDSGNNEVVLNFGYYIYSFLLFFYVLISFYQLVKKYKKADGVSQMQLKYISFGMLFAFIIGMSTNLFMPLFNNYQFIWVGPYSIIIAMGFIYYLILRKV